MQIRRGEEGERSPIEPEKKEYPFGAGLIGGFCRQPRVSGTWIPIGPQSGSWRWLPPRSQRLSGVEITQSRSLRKRPSQRMREPDVKGSARRHEAEVVDTADHRWWDVEEGGGKRVVEKSQEKGA